MVGPGGLFCGVYSPVLANGFYAGGTRFIRQGGEATISRAGAKVVEALHHLALRRRPPAPGSHWLELGASPGGMTAELLARGDRVTAVDRAPLDSRLDHKVGLTRVLVDAARYRPPPGVQFDAMLCDMNGEAQESMRVVAGLVRHLRRDGVVIFTLKLAGASSFEAINQVAAEVTLIAARAGLRLVDLRHLTYNRREFTMLLEKGGIAERSAAR